MYLCFLILRIRRMSPNNANYFQTLINYIKVTVFQLCTCILIEMYVQMEASRMKQWNILNTWITVVSVLCALWPSLLPTTNNQERRYHFMGTSKIRLFSQSNFLKMCPLSVAVIMVLSNSSGLINRIERMVTSGMLTDFINRYRCFGLSRSCKQNCSICFYIMKTTNLIRKFNFGIISKIQVIEKSV